MPYKASERAEKNKQAQQNRQKMDEDQAKINLFLSGKKLVDVNEQIEQMFGREVKSKL